MLTVLVPVGETSASSETVVFSTDFEGVGFFISEWAPLGWSRGDYAEGHEDDLWCRVNATAMETISRGSGVSITAHSTQSALYGARLGTNSANGVNNLVNGYPDPGMDSWVRFAPPNAASYDGMTLTFWYWAKTQEADFSGELTDYLCVNIYDGTTTTRAWTQPSPDSNGWQMATVELPAGTVWMEWEFKTSEETVGHYPGVLIDDVKVTTASPAAGSSSSKVGAMYQYYDHQDVFVPVTVSNADSLSLYYRTEGGSWTMYSDKSHPDGKLTTPITFNAPGDGRYELYTRAGNELNKSAPEASFIVDTTAPEVTITAPKHGTIYGSEALSLSWSAEDQASGIARTEVSVDDGPWKVLSGTSTYSLGTLADGEHEAKVKVTDRTGRSTVGSVSFVVDSMAPEMTVSPIGANASLDAKIVASFQEAVDHGSVAIEVSGVAGNLSWSGEDAVFTPSVPLEPEKTYEVTVSGRKAGGQEFSVNWSFTTKANTGNLSGTVRDPEGNGVPNAKVTLSNGASTTTDTAGRFEFTDVVPGRYTLTVTAEGYEALTEEAEVLAGENEELGVLSLSSAGTASASELLGNLDPALILVPVGALGVIALAALGMKKRR